MLMQVSVVDPAHFGVPSAAGRSPGEIDDWFIHRAPFVCRIGGMLSVLHPRTQELV